MCMLINEKDTILGTETAVDNVQVDILDKNKNRQPLKALSVGDSNLIPVILQDTAHG